MTVPVPTSISRRAPSRQAAARRVPHGLAAMSLMPPPMMVKVEEGLADLELEPMESENRVPGSARRADCRCSSSRAVCGFRDAQPKHMPCDMDQGRSLP
jgi:hypothetical protein